MTTRIGKIATVEQLRGLAALAVVVSHIGGHFWGWTRESPGPERLYGWLGQWGVALFFVISGFCIRLPMAQARLTDPAARLDVKDYAAHRFLRIAPPYWAAIALSLAAGMIMTTELIRPASGPSDVAAHVLGLHTLTPWTYYGINSVFWTIAVEVHFYLAYVLFANRPARLSTALLLTAAALIVYGAVSRALPPENPWRLVGQTIFVTSFWQWYLGAVLADAWVRTRPVWRARPLIAARILALGAGLALGLIDPTVLGLHLTYWLVHIVAAATLAVFIVQPASPIEVRACSRPAGFLGRISYSLYLLHPVVLTLVVVAVAKLVLPPIVGAALELAGSVLAATAMYAWLERPLLRRRARLPSTVTP